ncbi:MAG: P27 family phage terminase small subunit [Roseburia sp.]|nr:P27 family phage terminase small subunit [Roseburia sp.]
MTRLQVLKGQVTKALKRAGLWSPVLEIQITNLASAMLTLKIANETIEGLDSVMMEVTVGKRKKMEPHPVFKIQRDAMDQVNRQMKLLGLTTADVVGKPDVPDAGDALLAKVNSIS